MKALSYMFKEIMNKGGHPYATSPNHVIKNTFYKKTKIEL